jgi:citrate synthase
LEAELLDLSLVLHAEHGGGNNSAFSIHLVSSAGTDTYSAIGAAIGSLKGIKHGGANIKVRKMMEDIKSNVKNWDNEEELSGVSRKNLQKRSLRPHRFDLWDGPCGLHFKRSSSGAPQRKGPNFSQGKGMEAEFKLHELIERITRSFLDVSKAIPKRFAPTSISTAALSTVC